MPQMMHETQLRGERKPIPRRTDYTSVRQQHRCIVPQLAGLARTGLCLNTIALFRKD
jgi:hypothetical protein